MVWSPMSTTPPLNARSMEKPVAHLAVVAEIETVREIRAAQFQRSAGGVKQI